MGMLATGFMTGATTTGFGGAAWTTATGIGANAGSPSAGIAAGLATGGNVGEVVSIPPELTQTTIAPNREPNAKGLRDRPPKTCHERDSR